MKFILFSLLMLCLGLMPVAVPAQDDVFARALIRQVQDRLRSDTSVATYTMRIETADWQRQVGMDTWDDRIKKRFFIRILAPKKDKDTTWLKDSDNLWMYLPKLERDIRIPPSMMLSNWMGSDFTNDDLVKMESMVEDYAHRLLGEENDVYTVESVPQPDAPVVWGKIVRRITRDGIPLSEDFFDEHDKHIRHLAFDHIQKMGGRRIPARWIMQSLDTPEKRTVMLLERIIFDASIDDKVFTRANLRRKGR
jgi:outer membrane lipoprotein-sorting protein